MSDCIGDRLLGDPERREFHVLRRPPFGLVAEGHVEPCQASSSANQPFERITHASQITLPKN